jgi:hypothetical protein
VGEGLTALVEALQPHFVGLDEGGVEFGCLEELGGQCVFFVDVLPVRLVLGFQYVGLFLCDVSKVLIDFLEDLDCLGFLVTFEVLHVGLFSAEGVEVVHELVFLFAAPEFLVDFIAFPGC